MTTILLDTTPGTIAIYLFAALFLRGAYVTILDGVRGVAWLRERRAAPAARPVARRIPVRAS